VKPDAKFCPECGKPIPQKACPDCKTPLKPGAKFCPSCGKKVEDAPAAGADKKDPAKAPAPPASTDAKPPPKPVGPAQDADPDRTKQTRGEDLEKHGVTAEQVNQAIDRGAAFLAAKFKGVELREEEDYLLAYTLIHTAPYRTDAKLRDKILRFLKAPSWRKSPHAMYVVGLRALALEATHDPDLRPYLGECAQYLIEAQGPKGTWSYRAEFNLPEAAPPADPSSGRARITVLGGEPLEEEAKGEELKKLRLAKDAPTDGDNSTTQFAILGLHAASKAGFQIPAEVWKKCLEGIRARACPDGGWAYHDGNPTGAYGSMTCAGICTVAICRYYLGEKDPLDDPTLKAGLGWLAKNFSVQENPKYTNWDLYYIYSVERVGVFANTEKIGDHVWYAEGAKRLVQSQAPDGHWVGRSEAPHQSTSFAILFLTRATTPMRGSLKRGGNGWLETHTLRDDQNFLFIVDASGSMRDEMDGKEKFQIVKDVVESIVRKLPPGSLVGLRVYGHRKTALDEGCDLDSELVLPIGPLNAERFMEKVRPLRCRGMTPLTYSLREAIKDISRVPPEAELVTILLTDGGETTRGAKPPKAAAELAASRKGMKLHVVGFDINDEVERDQLLETAAAGGGRYFPARRAADLLRAFTAAAFSEAEFALLDRDGKTLAKGKLGDKRLELPEGKYRITLDLDGKKSEQAFWINTNVTTHVTVQASKK
jgi:Ca-activated chloride channel family protein